MKRQFYLAFILRSAEPYFSKDRLTEVLSEDMQTQIPQFVHQFYKLALNEVLGLPDLENRYLSSVSCSKLLKEAKNFE